MRYHRDNKKRGFRQQFGRLVARETFFVVVVTSVETRETENFHIDELAEDLIPPSCNIQWFVSLENGNRGLFTPVFNGIVSLLKVT